MKAKIQILTFCAVLLLRNLDEVREITERWRHDYNYNRPHEALGNMTPIEYKQKILNKNTNFDVNIITV
jgi:hypothetical protein